MIIVAIGQIIAAILLLISGVALLDAGGFFLPIIDIFAALWFLWNSIDRRDPPGTGRRSRLYDPIPAPTE